MSVTPPLVEVSVTLRLSRKTQQKLADLSRQEEKDLSAVASELIEQAVTRPDVDELLAAYRQQVKDSGMSDDELDAFHRDLLHKVRQESKAKSA